MTSWSKWFPTQLSACERGSECTALTEHASELCNRFYCLWNKSAQEFMLSEGIAVIPVLIPPPDTPARVNGIFRWAAGHTARSSDCCNKTNGMSKHCLLGWSQSPPVSHFWSFSSSLCFQKRLKVIILTTDLSVVQLFQAGPRRTGCCEV